MLYTIQDQKIIDTYNGMGPMDYYKKCAAVGKACHCSPTKVYKVMQRQARVEAIRDQCGKYSIAELDLPYQIFEALDKIGIRRIYECGMISGEYWKQYVRLGDRWWEIFQDVLSSYFGVDPIVFPFTGTTDSSKMQAAEELIKDMEQEYQVYKLEQSRKPKTSLADTLSMIATTKLMCEDHPYV